MPGRLALLPGCRLQLLGLLDYWLQYWMQQLVPVLTHAMGVQVAPGSPPRWMQLQRAHGGCRPWLLQLRWHLHQHFGCSHAVQRCARCCVGSAAGPPAQAWQGWASLEAGRVRWGGG